MIYPDFSGIELKLRKNGVSTKVWDPIRKKWIVLTPEEHVRQYLLHYLTGVMKYPAALMAVEKTIHAGTAKMRYDLVVYNRSHKPWMLAECKAPNVHVSQDTLRQLLNYQRTVQCSFWLLTNGIDTFCADARDPANINWLESLPACDL
jgi:hypothetical protein